MKKNIIWMILRITPWKTYVKNTGKNGEIANINSWMSPVTPQRIQ